MSAYKKNDRDIISIGLWHKTNVRVVKYFFPESVFVKSGNYSFMYKELHM